MVEFSVMHILGAANNEGIARVGQITETQELCESGTFFVILHRLDAPTEVFDDRRLNSVGLVVDRVDLYGDFFLHLAGDNDGIQGLGLRTDVANFIEIGREVGIHTHDIDGLEIIVGVISVFEIIGGNRVMGEVADVVLDVIIGGAGSPWGDLNSN